MNPSIVNNLPTDWDQSDPSTSKLRNSFGGIQVTIPGAPPTGGPNPKPPTGTVESRLTALELKVLVQDAAIQWLAEEVGKARK